MLWLGFSPLGAIEYKYSGEFLRTGLGVRETSLGGAVVAAPVPAAAVYWNPACLIANRTLNGLLMHAEEFAGVLSLDQMTLVWPHLTPFARGIGWLRLGVDDIPNTLAALRDYGSDGIGPDDPRYPGPDADGSEGNGLLDWGERLDFGKISYYGATENAFYISLARPFRPGIAIGGNLKALYKHYGQYYAFGVGFDLALHATFADRLQAGLVIRDLTTTLLFWQDGVKELILPVIQIGATYPLQLPGLKLTLNPLLGLDIEMEGRQLQTDLDLGGLALRVRFGLETIIRERIALRLGRDALGGHHLGLGIATGVGHLDYGLALNSATELGQSHRIGLVIELAALRQRVSALID